LSEKIEIVVPDIGDFDEVEVVEILVAKGDLIEFDDPLVSIESDKATMEIPSTVAGVVAEMRVAEGDRVSEGSVLVVIDAAEQGGIVENPADTRSPSSEEAKRGSDGSNERGAEDPSRQKVAKNDEEPPSRVLSQAAANPVPDRVGLPHASPLVRRYARELGVPVSESKGTGAHGRILIDDLKNQVRDRFAASAEGDSGTRVAAIPPMPEVDHAEFGPVREEKLTRIQKVSGPVLHRSWLNVPHVTQYDEADVTEMEKFRRDCREAASERGLKLSPLLFVMKAVVIALGEFPTLRASLAVEGDRLWIKDYFHLGIAVDTDQGLVVPVIRDVDRKGIFELAEELNATAQRARARKLGADDLRGACFTISSLGGIGGTAFSPIVNSPEVAILGLSKTRIAPVWEGPSPLDFGLPPMQEAVTSLAGATAEAREQGPGALETDGQFRPRMMLPFSLSYDHRVIDGAEAVRFTSRLSDLFSDPTNLLL